MKEREAEPAKYQVSVVVNVTYSSNQAHDQTFFELFSEIFQTATQEYRKYRFEVGDMKVESKGSGK